MKTFALLLLLATNAQAAALDPMAVLGSQQAIHCYGEDNISIVLNAKHTTLKYTVEGESNGAIRVYKVSTDRSTYVSFISKEGWLTFNARGSFYRMPGDQQSTTVDCEFTR